MADVRSLAERPQLPSAHGHNSMVGRHGRSGGGRRRRLRVVAGAAGTFGAALRFGSALRRRRVASGEFVVSAAAVGAGHVEVRQPLLLCWLGGRRAGADAEGAEEGGGGGGGGGGG